jgi:hypothetical protein
MNFSSLYNVRGEFPNSFRGFLLWPLRQLYLSRRSSVSHGVPFLSFAFDHALFVIVQRYRYDRI